MADSFTHDELDSFLRKLVSKKKSTVFKQILTGSQEVAGQTVPNYPNINTQDSSDKKGNFFSTFDMDEPVT